VEFDLLAALARAPGRVKSREQLLEEVRARDYEVFDRSIDVHIASLRKQLGDNAKDPRFIKTIRSVGYTFLSPAKSSFGFPKSAALGDRRGSEIGASLEPLRLGMPRATVQWRMKSGASPVLVEPIFQRCAGNSSHFFHHNLFPRRWKIANASMIDVYTPFTASKCSWHHACSELEREAQ
jgi:hypothetical protein